ncbi:MAG: glycoside hydrolase [Verrucomicrobia bacterium]|nr:glycoside hydrolase [Verrucomicrobiota bacterium]
MKTKNNRDTEKGSPGMNTSITRNEPADREPGLQLVRFGFQHPTATAVCIAGTFNDWRPNVTPMIPHGAGRWLKVVALPPGTYEYCLVVDGQWMPDPVAKDNVPNPFGGMNSLLPVEGCNPPPRR